MLIEKGHCDKLVTFNSLEGKTGTTDTFISLRTLSNLTDTELPCPIWDSQLTGELVAKLRIQSPLVYIF